MTWQAGGVIPGQVRKPATGGLMAGRQSDQKKAAWRPLRHLIRLRWTSREFDFDRIGFGQAIHFYGGTLRHLLGLRQRTFSLAAFHLVVILLLSSYLFGTFLPTITISGQIYPPWGSKCQNSGSPETAGVLTLRLCGLEFYHVLGLSPLGTLDHFKLHFLVFRQGAEAVALDGAVMHKDIRTALPGDKAKALGVIKPFYLASFLHC